MTAPGPGVRARSAPDQIARIIAVACEPPEDSGRPVTHWTPTRVGRGGGGTRDRPVDLRPPRRAFFKSGRTPAAPESVLAERQPEGSRGVRPTGPGRVRLLPRAAPARSKDGVHTVCVDEMTGIQAKERIAPTKPMRPGQVEKARVRVQAARDAVPDRELRGGDRAGDRPDGPGDAERGGLRRPHRADGGDGPGGGLDLRGGQPDDAHLGDAGAVGGRGVRDRGRVAGEEGEERGAEVGGDAEGVPDGRRRIGCGSCTCRSTRRG